MNQRIFISLALLIASMGAALDVRAQARPSTVPYTDLQLTQLMQESPFDERNMSPNFLRATDNACNVTRAHSAAPLVVAAALGIVVDWIFGRAGKGLSNSVAKRVKEYSASYSTPVTYRSFFDNKKWSSPPRKESCLVLRRVECQVDKKSIEDGTAACPTNGAGVGLALGIKLRNEGTYLRVLPYAVELSAPKPKHTRGEVAIAATLRLQAPDWNPKQGGSLWVSPTIDLFAHKCNVDSNGGADKDCFKDYPLDDAFWEKASVIPMPPRTVQAVVFEVGEVGTPPQGLKGFAEFLDANHETLSGALSEAFKKKVGVATE